MKKLAQCVENAAKPLARRYGGQQMRLFTQWAVIVGPALAKHTLPKKLSFPKDCTQGGTLTLQAASGWAVHVQHLQPVILEKIAAFFGYRAVGRLVLLQAPLPASKSDLPTVRASSAALPPSVKSLLAQTPDEALHQALHSLAQRVWQAHSSVENPS